MNVIIKPLTFVILAVTKTFDSYCIAGIDLNGKWYRPLPPNSKFWSSLSYNDNSLIKVGDVWEISQYQFEPDPISIGHTEDIRIISYEHIKRKKVLTNDELVRFVNKHREIQTTLENTLNANKRSLCLIKIESFEVVENELRMIFQFEGKQYKNTTKKLGFPIPDLKWRAYLKRNKTFPNEYNSIYACIGLARKEPKKELYYESPMIISLITDPIVKMLDSYPN